MNSNNKNLVLIGLLVVIVGLGGIWTYIKYNSASKSPVADLGLVTYVNAQGQDWSIPKGEYSFSVTSAKKYPKFVTGFINPLDVKVGDIQKMLVAVNSDSPLKRVWAEVETDNTVKMVEMKLESSAPVSKQNPEDQPYLIDSKGVLTLNPHQKQEGANLAKELVQTTEAADGVNQYRYEGEWTVADTHTKTYHTRFVAEDSKGNLDSLTLAWSDPVCSFSPYGLLQNDCSVSAGIEGFESQYATQADLNGHNITLGPNTKFVFNGGSGNGIIIGSGGFNKGTTTLITSGATLEQGYLCIEDSDADGFPGNVTRYKDTSATCDNIIAGEQINARRVRDLINPDMLDCYDGNANAKPGQTTWFTTDRGDGSFDYDCNSSQQKNYDYSGTITYIPNASIPNYCTPSQYYSSCNIINPPYTAYGYLLKFYKNGVFTGSYSNVGVPALASTTNDGSGGIAYLPSGASTLACGAATTSFVPRTGDGYGVLNTPGYSCSEVCAGLTSGTVSGAPSSLTQSCK